MGIRFRMASCWNTAQEIVYDTLKAKGFVFFDFDLEEVGEVD